VYVTDDQWYVLFFTFIILSSLVTLCDKVCQWLATSRWFFPGPSVSFIDKTDRHDITEILLKVALNTITITPTRLWLPIGVLKWVTWWLLLVEQEMLNSRGIWVQSQFYVGRVVHSLVLWCSFVDLCMSFLISFLFGPCSICGFWLSSFWNL